MVILLLKTPKLDSIKEYCVERDPDVLGEKPVSWGIVIEDFIDEYPSYKMKVGDLVVCVFSTPIWSWLIFCSPSKGSYNGNTMETGSFAYPSRNRISTNVVNFTHDKFNIYTDFYLDYKLYIKYSIGLCVFSHSWFLKDKTNERVRKYSHCAAHVTQYGN